MTVLFTSQRPLERAENLKAVYDAFDGEKAFLRLNQQNSLPDLHSGKYSVQVTDELVSDAVDKCLFIGHGMGAFKKYGLDQPRPYFRKPELLTYAIASSKEMVPIVARQLGLEQSQVLPVGMPRTDAYFRASKIEKAGKNYLYAPTFHNNKTWIPDWEQISNGLTMNNDIFVVKPHMVTGRIMPFDKYWNNIVEYDSGIPTTDFLVKSDVLITDYSSIIFDAMVMRKPTVLFAKDKDAYMQSRGIYLKYPDMYSEYYCETESELVQMIQMAEWNDRDDELRQFFTGACDGKSTQRVIEVIRSMM